MPARSLSAIRREAATCRACPLWENATQTVFGEGRPESVVMLVGEQPGDHEDRTGKPFVGPAGRLLDEALAEAGIDRSAAHVTNAVKHFKWQARGKRRIHAKPSWSELAAAGRGSRRSSPRAGRAFSSASARRRRSHSSAATSA